MILIREFLCVLEHGLMLFHVSCTPEDKSIDHFLRSSLISALYSFANQVEDDTIETLQMGKVSLVFRKQEELIFILALDASINPAWCVKELVVLQQEFFRMFPEIQWHKEVVLDLRIFDTFKTVVKQHILTLNKRVKLLRLLHDEHLITENDSLDHAFNCLGEKVARWLLQRYRNHLIEAIHQKRSTLDVVDRLLDLLEGNNITRLDTTYSLDCATCGLCQSTLECFFEAFLDLVLTQLGYETTLEESDHIGVKYLHFKKL